MAQLTSDVTYEQLKQIGDWHLTEEAEHGGIGERDREPRHLFRREGRTAASDALLAGRASRRER